MTAPSAPGGDLPNAPTLDVKGAPHRLRRSVVVLGCRDGCVDDVGEFGGGGQGAGRDPGAVGEGVVRDGDGVRGACEGVAHHSVVAFRAEQDPDGRGVAVRFAQLVVDQGDVEAELAGVLRLEGSDLELDDDVAQLVGVEDYLELSRAFRSMTCMDVR